MTLRVEPSGLSYYWDTCKECPRYIRNGGKCYGETVPGACIYRTKGVKK